MGQSVAKREVKKGLELYDLKKLEHAVDEWNKALHRLTGQGDTHTKFVILGYLNLAYFDMGKYKCVISCARTQLEAAATVDEEMQACLNLSRAHERLGEYDIAEEYCKKCLSRDKKDSPWTKYACLLYGRLHFKQCDIFRALKYLEEARVSDTSSEDLAFRILLNVSYGQIFAFLNDMETGCMYVSKCVDIIASNPDSDLSKKYHKCVQLEQVKLHLENSRLNEALDTCEVRVKSIDSIIKGLYTQYRISSPRL